MDSTSDARRDAFLRSRGFHVLRFWNHDILANPEGVRTVIARCLANALPRSRGRVGVGASTNDDARSMPASGDV